MCGLHWVLAARKESISASCLMVSMFCPRPLLPFPFWFWVWCWFCACGFAVGMRFKILCLMAIFSCVFVISPRYTFPNFPLEMRLVMLYFFPKSGSMFLVGIIKDNRNIFIWYCNIAVIRYPL